MYCVLFRFKKSLFAVNHVFISVSALFALVKSCSFERADIVMVVSSAKESMDASVAWLMSLT